MDETTKKPFNWLAALFGFYWFPFKGLWREFRLYYVYIGLVNILIVFLSKLIPSYEIFCYILMSLIDIAAIIHIGLNASRYRDEYCHGKSFVNIQNNFMAANIASVLYLVLISCSVFVAKHYVNLIKFQKESVTRTLAFTYKIDTNQMYPTYSIGDGLFIDSTVPEIYAGDIIAYRVSPSDALQVARVIAISGDNLIRKNGVITVNDRLIESKIINKAEFIDTLPEEYQVEKYLVKQEVNENISYFILTSGKIAGDLNFKVPNNKIFVIIDNRDLDNSAGQLIDLENVVGVNTQ